MAQCTRPQGFQASVSAMGLPVFLELRVEETQYGRVTLHGPFCSDTVIIEIFDSY